MTRIEREAALCKLTATNLDLPAARLLRGCRQGLVVKSVEICGVKLGEICGVKLVVNLVVKGPATNLDLAAMPAARGSVRRKGHVTHERVTLRTKFALQ